MKRSHLFVLLAGLLGFGLSCALYLSNWFEGLERAAQDTHLRSVRLAWATNPGSTGQPAANGQQEIWVGPGEDYGVVIVAIDERTFAEFNAEPEQSAVWPFSPKRLHRLAEKLQALGATRIGFVFPPPTTDAALQATWNEQAIDFAGQVGRSLPPVVFGRTSDGGKTLFNTGSLSLLHDSDDVVRRYRLRGADTATPAASSDDTAKTDDTAAAADMFALALMRAEDNDAALQGARGWLGENGNPVANEGRIFWSGPTSTFPRVSFSDVLNDKVPADVIKRFTGTDKIEKLFNGKVVLVGITWPPLWTAGAAVGSIDAWGVRTPWYQPEDVAIPIETLTGTARAKTAAARMPVVEVQANIVQMLLTERSKVTFRIAPREDNLKLLAVACLIMVLAVALFPPLVSATILLCVIAGSLFGTHQFFTSQRMLFGSMGPIMGACITYAFGMIASWLAERKEKRFIQTLFGKYVSKEVARQIASSREAPKLGGERRELSVMFSDIAGFTAWSEQLGPEQLLDLLNQYLGAMTDVIFEKQGTLDKFMGDAVMAFWNAPVARKDHAARACEAALLMRTRLAELNRGWLATGLKPLSMRIGVNSGECVVGNAGSGQRFDYTAFGDNVNLASRLEGTAKFYGISIVISAATYKQAGGPDRFGARHVDRVRVVGLSKPVDIFELLCTKKELDQDPDLTRFLSTFASGVTAYFERDWPNASKAFMVAQKMRPDDGPTRVFLARIQRFSRQAPPPNWDGSVELPVK
ncbi:MAG: adenylate/guanylate cyclase domain-containing protein [Planctomycetota bacterium]